MAKVGLNVYVKYNLKMLRSLFTVRTFCFILLSFFCIETIAESEFCEKLDEYEENDKKCNVQSHFSRSRYILYDVNRPEGFNLRRDVYIRVAVFAKNLISQEKDYKWQLVLPPWGNLYHWRSTEVGDQVRLPWNMFFDIGSLQKYAPVIEMHKFLEEYATEAGETRLDAVYVLQNDEEMFKTGKFREKNEVIRCAEESLQYQKVTSEKWYGPFWGYRNVTAKSVKCIKFHGMMSDLKVNLKPLLYRSIMFDHMEIPLHDFYGSQEYWKARRSMRYNAELYEIANLYRKEYLNSTDENDKTKRPDDWTREENRRNAVGGPYLSVHLRRRDFLLGHSSTVPTIKSAASQLKKKLDELGLKSLFVATDATEKELEELKTYLSNYSVFHFVPSNYVLNKFKDGGVAIIDQIICSYARYFIGTHESTFTFRIQEDREIIGFPCETTFNRLCKTKEKCESTGRWEIVW